MRAAGPHAGVPAVRIPARWSVSDRSDGRGRAAGRLDLLLGRAGELVDRHVDLDVDLAGAEHLDGPAVADRALRHEVVDGHVAAVGVERREAVEVDDLVLDAERVGEPAQLRQPHVQRHLATLEPLRHLVAGLGALGTATGGLALGAFATTDAGLGRAGPRRRAQVMHLEGRAVALRLLGLVSHGSLHFFHGDEVRHGADHAPDLRAVLLDDDVTDALETEAAQRLAVVALAADLGSGLGHFEPWHQDPAPARAALSARSARPAAWARSIAAGATSSRLSPRRAATASGRSRLRSASTVAWTMLMALLDPSDLLRTSWMPAHSSTARTGPPAMTPVPGDAGRSMTTPAAASPWTGCGMVPWMRGTAKNAFLASSTPLAIAAGTSLALP